MVWGNFPQNPPKIKKNSQINIASAHIHIPRNNPAKFQNYLMDSLRGVADPKMKKSQIKIASARIHIPRNNPAKFQNYLMDSLRGVADKGPLHIFTSKKWFWGEFPLKSPPQIEKIPNLNS